MKIVISTDIYYPMTNGVAVFSRNLATGLTKRGHQVMVLAPSITGNFGIEEDSDGKFTVDIADSLVFLLETVLSNNLLKDINLSVDPGNMVMILGGSGAGKSTFVNAVTGYEKAKATITEGGVDYYQQ